MRNLLTLPVQESGLSCLSIDLQEQECFTREDVSLTPISCLLSPDT